MSVQTVEIGVRVSRVLVVDDHRTFAELLCLALDGQPDFECIGTASTGSEALRRVRTDRPDLVVMDIQLAEENGLDITRSLRAAAPSAIVVVVSAYQHADWIVRAAQAGASAFAPKSGSLEELLGVLRSARAGAMVIGTSMFIEPTTTQTAPSAAPCADRDEQARSLTAREREVLSSMVRGESPVETARLLGISVHTCRGYVKSIYAKLNVRSQLQAVVSARDLGLVDAPGRDG